MFLKSDLLCHHHEQSLHQLLRGPGGVVCACLSQITVSTGGHRETRPKAEASNVALRPRVGSSLDCSGMDVSSVNI